MSAYRFAPCRDASTILRALRPIMLPASVRNCRSNDASSDSEHGASIRTTAPAIPYSAASFNRSIGSGSMRGASSSTCFLPAIFQTLHHEFLHRRRGSNPRLRRSRFKAPSNRIERLCFVRPSACDLAECRSQFSAIRFAAARKLAELESAACERVISCSLECVAQLFQFLIDDARRPRADDAVERPHFDRWSNALAPLAVSAQPIQQPLGRL